MSENAEDSFERHFLNEQRWQRLTPAEQEREACRLLRTTQDDITRLYRLLGKHELSPEYRARCQQTIWLLLAREDKLLTLEKTARYVRMYEEAEAAIGHGKKTTRESSPE